MPRPLSRSEREQFLAEPHVCPSSTSDVPDDPTARLVILRPEQAHKRGRDDPVGRTAAAEFLAQRGNTPRLNRNTLVFLAPDDKELENLLKATASYLAASADPPRLALGMSSTRSPAEVKAW